MNDDVIDCMAQAIYLAGLDCSPTVRRARRVADYRSLPVAVKQKYRKAAHLADVAARVARKQGLPERAS